MNAKANTQTVQQIKLTDLQPDPDQPRKYFDKKALKELADDINARGIIEPIIYFVSEDGQKTILAGERRYRAAKLINLATVPCLERDPGEPIDRLFDQVSENFQREGLNPIEMAMFFEQLVTKHNILAKDIGTKCYEYGFRKFERSYISNLRRLLILPKWAQTMIQKGAMSAAHGKYLLTAMASDKVMAECKAFLKKQPCTTAELEDCIDENYQEHHMCVNYGRYDENESWRRISTEFDYQKECKACKTCQKFNTHFGRSLIYCMNEACYGEKQAAAIEASKKAEEKKNKAAETRRKNQLKKKAKEQGCSIEELEQSEAVLNAPINDDRAKARAERTQQYLDNWLRPRIEAHLLEDEATRYQVVLWKSAGAPGSGQYWPPRPDIKAWNRDVGGASIDEENLPEESINLTLKNKFDQTQLELMVCHETIERMDRENLRILAHHCGIKLQGEYQVDADYLNVKTKDEIVAITPTEPYEKEHGLVNWQNICNGKASTLKEKILEKPELFGIPADLVEMYSNVEA